MLKIKLPDDVEFILQILSRKYKAYIVGGCVRDSLLGIQPHDWDITTNANPDEVEEAFKDFKVISTGKKYGTVTLNIDNKAYEITTFRADSIYSDGRRPDQVFYSDNIVDDLSRRDFTINAMAYSEYSNGLIDPFNGEKDLKDKILRCVGKPEERIGEDALRALRGIRFAYRYDLTIEEETFKAIKNVFESGLIKNVSKERVHDEIIKILNNCSNKCDRFNYSEKIKYILPILNYIFNMNLNLESNEGLFIFSHYPYLFKIFLLFIWLKKDIAFDNLNLFLKDYKFSNVDIDTAKQFYIINQEFDNETSYRYDKGINLILLFKKLLSKGISEQNIKIYFKFISYDNNLTLALFQPHKLSDLKIDGDDLIKLGYKDKIIGIILNDCLEEIIKNPELNVKDKLYKYISDKYEEGGNDKEY